MTRASPISYRIPLTLDSLSALRFDDAATFVIYSNSEGYERANVPYWEERVWGLPRSSFAVLQPPARPGFFNIFAGSVFHSVQASDFRALRSIVPEGAHVLVDISATGHQFIASCLVACRDHAATLTCLYTEPKEYRFRNEPPRHDPFDPALFDLSDAIDGIEPLPGFANLLGPGTGDAAFVPMLGFEGARPLNVLNTIDPSPHVVIPVVGVPGYRMEFPTHTVSCNRNFLQATEAGHEIRHAAAFDPYDLIATLEEIRTEYPAHYLYLAPVGTRPHALGALMFAAANPESVEVLFDHPRHRGGSRKGVGATHVYRVY